MARHTTDVIGTSGVPDLGFFIEDRNQGMRDHFAGGINYDFADRRVRRLRAREVAVEQDQQKKDGDYVLHSRPQCESLVLRYPLYERLDEFVSATVAEFFA